MWYIDYYVHVLWSVTKDTKLVYRLWLYMNTSNTVIWDSVIYCVMCYMISSVMWCVYREDYIELHLTNRDQSSYVNTIE